MELQLLPKLATILTINNFTSYITAFGIRIFPFNSDITHQLRVRLIGGLRKTDQYGGETNLPGRTSAGLNNKIFIYTLNVFGLFKFKIIKYVPM
jgi:hypothetical protein